MYGTPQREVPARQGKPRWSPYISSGTALGEPAERILRQNFGKTEKRAYAHIHHLFECRNQIAHEGKPTYKNRRGRLRSADQAVAQEWFKAADRLFTWLRRMQP
jgi:hypothetical protein